MAEMANNAAKGKAFFILDTIITLIQEFASRSGSPSKRKSYYPCTTLGGIDGQQFPDNYQAGTTPFI